jgi:peptide deformylase
MTLLKIITVPDPVLKTVAQPVARVDDAVRQRLEDMRDTMYDAPGIGLAANQVNVLQRLIVCNVQDGTWEYSGEEKHGVLRLESQRPEEEKNQPLLMANPVVVWESEQRSVYEEGCLSIPGQYADVERPASVRVKYLDIENTEQEILAEGLLSHCVQHEIDHLNGILFVDYLSSLKRNMMLRKVAKLLKDKEAL